MERPRIPDADAGNPRTAARIAPDGQHRWVPCVRVADIDAVEQPPAVHVPREVHGGSTAPAAGQDRPLPHDGVVEYRSCRRVHGTDLLRWTIVETEAEPAARDAGEIGHPRGFVLTGIDGLDEMLGRGVPTGHIITVLGSFGTGKTTFALQFLMQGLINGEKAIFISLEEDADSVIANAASFGWDLPKYIKEKKLHIVKLEPADAKTTVTRIRSELPDFIKRSGASRVAIDSVSLLNMLFADDKERREKLFALCKQLKSTEATCIFTAEVKDDNPRSSRDGLVEYVSDGVIGLRFNERENGEVQLVMQVIKMRRLKHPRSVKPYSITEQGLEAHGDMEVF